MSYNIDEVDLIFDEFEERVAKVLNNYKTEMRAIRAGRANPHILDKLVVDYYGTPTPINNMANISVPEARLLVIAPWDKSQLKPIEKAILAGNIGITPNNDGQVIRLIFPELTEERRRNTVKEAKTFVEIVVPMIKPGIGALAIFTFINSWNDYFMQLIMLSSTSKLTISLGIAKLQAENSTDFGLIMAGATLAAVPIIVVFVAFQKYFTQGIAMGAVKG